MNKNYTNNIILGCACAFIMLAISFGLYKLIQFATGTTPAQIEAQQRMQKASEMANDAMEENYQWYRDQMAAPCTSIVSHDEVEICGLEKTNN